MVELKFWTVTVNKLFQDLTDVSVFIAFVSCSTIFTREICDGKGRTLCYCLDGRVQFCDVV